MPLLLFFSLLLSVASSGATPPPQRTFIEKDVERLVSLFGDGVAVSYPRFRHTTFGKIFGSKREDAIALFNIEGFHGGNYHAEYLAFFEAVEPDHVAGYTNRLFRLVAVTQIGGRMWRSFDWKTIKLGSGSVTLSGKKWGPQDAACCPTVPIQVAFRVKEGFISESK